MRETYSETKLPDRLKDGPITLAIWLVGGMSVVLVMVLLV